MCYSRTQSSLMIIPTGDSRLVHLSKQTDNIASSPIVDRAGSRSQILRISILKRTLVGCAPLLLLCLLSLFIIFDISLSLSKDKQYHNSLTSQKDRLQLDNTSKSRIQFALRLLNFLITGIN